jgi:hypothetical protein
MLEQLRIKCDKAYSNRETSYRLTHIPKNTIEDNNEYWEFSEIDSNKKEKFGFSSPDFPHFEETLLGYLSMT